MERHNSLSCAPSCQPPNRVSPAAAVLCWSRGLQSAAPSWCPGPGSENGARKTAWGCRLTIFRANNSNLLEFVQKEVGRVLSSLRRNDLLKTPCMLPILAGRGPTPSLVTSHHCPGCCLRRADVCSGLHWACLEGGMCP